MNRTISSFVVLLVLWLAAVPVLAQESMEAPVDSILNWRVISSDLYTAGQPGPQHMAALKAQGIDTIVSLATPSEANVWEANHAEALGMSFASIPFGEDGPTPDDVEWFNGVMQAQEGKTVLVHCNSNRRASAFTFLYRVLVEGVDPDVAMADVKTVFDPAQSATWSGLIDQMLSDTTESAVIIQPGAPGQEGTIIEDTNQLSLGLGTHTEADVAFMQGMIHHHAQAIEMVSLMEGRTNARDLTMLGKRIDISQQSEIKLMVNWLKERDEAVPMMHATGEEGHAHGDHAGHQMDQPMMPGMLSAEQMQQLHDSEGTDFYRLWLLFMIQHHEGALTMVDELFSSPGAGQNQDIFHFASEVDIDQRIEILRMQQMLATVSSN
jgi:uncharacterized protein (DUF305 family)/protein tyrosine phosphatase (PTP) superfamily phosphohydrolase (DUF442 family)